MATSRDTKYLENHGGQWRVTLPIPKRFQEILGKTRLKKPLGTGNLAIANRMKDQVVAELRAQIVREQDRRRGDRLFHLREAFQFGEDTPALDPERRPDEYSHYYDGAAQVANGLLVVQSIECYYNEDNQFEQIEVEHYTPESERLAEQYMALALGVDEVPVDLFYKEYVAQLKLKAKTIGDDKLAIDTLRKWCSHKRVPFTLQAITTKFAKEFAQGLSAFRGGIHARTVHKYITRLGSYWEYLRYIEYTSSNPWREVKVKIPATPYREEERAFNTDEVLLLLQGPAPERMRDLMMIALLSGARIDAIVDLRVSDIDLEQGTFQFKPQKKEKSERFVPIHPALLPIVEKRLVGKPPQGEFFPEWPRRSANSKAARSAEASKLFTRYRKSCGVHVPLEGYRRSRVNFHSFRRWFITQAERENFNANLIAAIVGHKSPGITLGRYSEGPLEQQARKCVNAIRVPVDGQKNEVAVRSRAARPAL